MNEKAKTIGMIADMLQAASPRELDLIWRILRSMLNRKGAAA